MWYGLFLATAWEFFLKCKKSSYLLNRSIVLFFYIVYCKKMWKMNKAVFLLFHCTKSFSEISLVISYLENIGGFWER